MKQVFGVLNRINGWQRIGVIVSVAWLIFINYEVYKKYKEQILDCEFYPYICDQTLAWDKIFLVELGVLFLGWLTAYLLIYVTKWVIAGFRSNSNLTK